MGQLTKRQRRLRDEIREVRTLLGLDEEQVAEMDDRSAVTAYLESVKRDLIRGAVLSEYVLFDEFLSSLVCVYFFDRDFVRLWRTKRFQRFNYFVIEKLSLIHKLDLVHDISPVPRSLRSYLLELNGIRNALAHAFFPENLRGRRTFLEGADVFTIEGLRRFGKPPMRHSTTSSSACGVAELLLKSSAKRTDVPISASLAAVVCVVLAPRSVLLRCGVRIAPYGGRLQT